MRSRKLAVVFVVLFSLLASVQCVASCTTMPCDRSSTELPPCHQHQPSESKPCVSPLLIADTRTHVMPHEAPPAIVAVVESVEPVVSLAAFEPRPVDSPADGGGPAFSVLRI